MKKFIQFVQDLVSINPSNHPKKQAGQTALCPFHG